MSNDLKSDVVTPDAVSGFAGAFPSPLAVLAFYDPDIREERYHLWPWQTRLLKAFAAPREKGKKRKIALVANNGAGKSKFILAPCVVWSAVNFAGAQIVVTSASGDQLDKQAGRYIKDLAAQMNRLHREEFGGEDIWEIKYRTLIFKPSGDQKYWSYVDLFATDEANKAEGWHPRLVDGELMIFVDEAKTIAEPIFGALERCNGCTYRMDISSPGDICGSFYEAVTRPELAWDVHKVTAYQCPHITKEEIDYMIVKYGIHDPLVRSSIFAEFTSADGEVVIKRQTVLDCKAFFNDPCLLKGKRAGLDLAAGGDENVLSVWEGHKMIDQRCFTFRDTAQTVRFIIDLIKEFGLEAENIYADDGGVGRGLLDQLRERGYTVKRVLNQARPMDTTRYANRGTELWWEFKRLLEERQLLLLEDKTLIDQIVTRAYRRQPSTEKLLLEPKKEAKAKGRPSPDRADAAVLANAGLTYPLSVGTENASKNSRLSLEEFRRAYERGTLDQFTTTQQKPAFKVFEYAVMKDKPYGTLQRF